MSIQQFKWLDPTPVPIQFERELEAYTPTFRSILYQRGICSEEEAVKFLLPTQPAWYPDHQLLNTDKCCQIIRDVISNNEQIVIYGDYDADGITGTVLLTQALSKLSENIISYIPNRLTEGYGLNKEALMALAGKKTKLVLTVDNGIRSIKEVDFANSLGMKVIITDHHTPGDILPEAAAILNPKLPDDTYPDKNLAGVGVAYKLISGLAKYFPEINPAEYLDLVAIGTIADIVPLVNENRYLVKRGLSSINLLQRQSLVSLIGVSNLTARDIRSSDVSFQIGPRINAPGRINSADLSLNLLLASDPQLCGILSQEIEITNFKRKSISKVLQKQAEDSILQAGTLPSILFAFDSEYHPGVAGIAAGYLSRKYYLPVVVGNTGPKFTTASCRSIPEFNIVEALDQCHELLLDYGGHAMAAGFTILNEKLPDFKNELTEHAESILLSLELQPTLSIDAEVNLSNLDNKLYSALEKLEPTGSENHVPIFLTKNLLAKKIRTVGQDNGHLKLILSDGQYSIDAIGFNLGELKNKIPTRFDAVYHFDQNDYQGRKTFQMILLDLRPT